MKQNRCQFAHNLSLYSQSHQEQAYTEMKQNRIKKKRKLLFDEQPQQHEQTVQNSEINPVKQHQQKNYVKSKSQVKFERADQIYDAKAIKQNEIYVRSQRQKKKTDVPQTTPKQQVRLQRRKRILKSKAKKNIFQSSEEEEDKQNKNQQQVQNVKNKQQCKKQQHIKQVLGNATINENIKYSVSQQTSINKPEHANSKFNIDVDSSSQSNIDQKQSQNNVVTFEEQPILVCNKQQQQCDSVSSQKGQNSQGECQEQQQQHELTFLMKLLNIKNDLNYLRCHLYQPLPKGFIAYCQIKRSTYSSQSYQLYFDDIDDPILFCHKKHNSIGANYYIGLKRVIKKHSQSYVGKIRGNAIGSTYTIYDNGREPNKQSNRRDWRTFMARIDYQHNFMGLNGPRRLRVIIPQIQHASELDTFKFTQQEQKQLQHSQSVFRFRNKHPQWIQSQKSFGLNFGGRVKQASIKNFILVNDDPTAQQQSNNHAITFGKINEKAFSLQIQYPLSVFQAFAIAVTQFDFKFLCQ